nr:hypothetical protein Q903MT_gene678 [Picea sitchensis]
MGLDETIPIRERRGIFLALVPLYLLVQIPYPLPYPLFNTCHVGYLLPWNHPIQTILTIFSKRLKSVFPWPSPRVILGAQRLELY